MACPGRNEVSAAIMSHSFAERLHQRPLLLDGGVGTLLQRLGGPPVSSLELLTLTEPARVQQVHKLFIEAGAEIISTNTFSASGRALEPFGAAHQVRDVNRRAVRLAREVRELQGVHALVSGSVGPLGGHGFGGLGAAPETELVRHLFREQIAALVEGGADLIALETFTDLTEILLALEAARTVTDLPVIAMMAFDDDGRTVHGQTAAEAAERLRAAGAAVVGANCGSGPRSVLNAVRQMAEAIPGFPLAAMPNAGMPHRAHGRLFYPTGTEYAGAFALEAAALGARLIGGCCGMGPEHIAAMSAALQSLPAAGEAAVAVTGGRSRPGPARSKAGSAGAPAASAANTPGESQGAAGSRTSLLGERLASGQFVISVEMHPPRSHLTGAFLRAAREYKQSGVELVNLVDSPMARVRMSSLMACALIQERVGLETIAHLTPRDRTLLGLQADLIGAHALGVRNILCVTGDPHQGGMAPGTINVYDVDSIGMVRLLAGYNRGVDIKGNDIGQPARFLIGGALNPNAPDLGLEVERFHQKVEAGIQYAMVQPVFDIAVLEKMLDRLGRPPVPVIAGICPIHSYQHALLLHNEIPGIQLTEAVLERMRRAEQSAEQEGIAIARELLAAARACCQGVYIMPSYGRHETALKVLQG